jgi:hypothetical protein
LVIGDKMFIHINFLKADLKINLSMAQALKPFLVLMLVLLAPILLIPFTLNKALIQALERALKLMYRFNNKVQFMYAEGRQNKRDPTL